MQTIHTHVHVHVRTHGLVLGADGGGMVENQDVSFKLPAGNRVQAGVHQHHALANLVATDLHRMK